MRIHSKAGIVAKVCCAAGAFLIVVACDAYAGTAGVPLSRPAQIYADQPKGDPGVPSRCAAIVNPAERRKCILSSGGG